MAGWECSPSEAAPGDAVSSFAVAYSELMQSRTRFETACAELSQATKRFAEAQHQLQHSAGSIANWPYCSTDYPSVVQGLETTSDSPAPASAPEWNPKRVRDALLSALLHWGPSSVAPGLPGPSSSSTPSYPPHLMDALSVSWPGVPEVDHQSSYNWSADPSRLHSSQGVPEEHRVFGDSQTPPVHLPRPQQDWAPDASVNVAYPPCTVPCAHAQQLAAPPGLPSVAALVPAPTAGLLSTAGLPSPVPTAVAPSQSSQPPAQKRRPAQILATAAIPESMAQAEAEMQGDDSTMSVGVGNESPSSSRHASAEVAAKTPETAPTTLGSQEDAASVGSVVDDDEDPGCKQSVGQDLSQDYAAAVTSFLTGDIGAMAEEGCEEDGNPDEDVDAEAMPKGMPTPEECISFSKGSDAPFTTPSLNFHEFSPAAETHQTVTESATTQQAPQVLCQKRQRPQVPSEYTDASARVPAIGAPHGVFPPRPATRAATPPNALAYEPHSSVLTMEQGSSAWHQLSLAIAARSHAEGVQPDFGPPGIAHALALETAVHTATSSPPFLSFPAPPSASQSLPVGAAAPVSRRDDTSPVQVQASLCTPCAAFPGCCGGQGSEGHDADAFEPTAGDDTEGRKERRSDSQGTKQQQTVRRRTLGELLSGERPSAAGPTGQVRPEALAVAMMEEGVSTLMIRNVPNTVTQKWFLEELGNTGFRDLFDFFYMPSSFGTGAGKGYAFVNLVNTQAVGAFVREWHLSRRFSMLATDSPLNVSKADVQGRAQNAKKWDAPRIRRVRNPALRPLVIERDAAE